MSARFYLGGPRSPIPCFAWQIVRVGDCLCGGLLGSSQQGAVANARYEPHLVSGARLQVAACERRRRPRRAPTERSCHRAEIGPKVTK